jgi:hypothetical protein
MIATKTQFLVVAALSAYSLNAMEQYSEITIKNELFCEIFLNVKNPSLITSKSPYPFVKGGRSKTFLIHDEEKEHQSLAFPNGYPSDIVKLPIEKNKTYFTIKKHPQEFQKIIVEDSESKKVISELLILMNAK